MRGIASGILIAAAAAGARAQCCPTERSEDHVLPFSATENASPEILADDRGGVYRLWPAAPRTLSVSDDDGHSWSAPVEAPPVSLLHVLSDGTLLFFDSSPAGVVVRRSVDRARTVGSAIPVLDLAAVGGGGQLVAASHAAGQVVLLSVSTAVTGQVAAAAVSSDGGETWGPGTVLLEVPPELPPQWAVAASGTTALVAWVRAGVAWTRRSTDGGLSWSPPGAASPAVVPALGGRAIHAGSTGPDTFQLAYEEQGSPRPIHVAVSVDGGLTWPHDSVVGSALDEWAMGCSPSGDVVLAGLFHADFTSRSANGSAQHGLPGTWHDASPAYATLQVSFHEPRFAFVGSHVAASWDDYRTASLGDCLPVPGCEDVYVALSCDLGRTFREIRLDRDDPAIGYHSEDARIAFGSGRLHAAWVDGLGAGSATQRAVALDRPGSPRPALTARTEPRGDCLPPRLEVDLDPASVPGCDAAGARWTIDGVPAGTGSTLALPPSTEPGVRRVAVLVDCGGDDRCRAAASMVVDVPAPPPHLAVGVELQPADGCLPESVVLAVPGAVLASCGSAVVEWTVDGSVVPGATSDRFEASLRTLAPGSHDVSYRLACDPALTCSTSETASVVVLPPTGGPPADVGPALRATGHGDPRAPVATADFEWRLDRGAPRSPTDHFHVLRGTDPRGLALVPGTHPTSDPSHADATPASMGPRLVHFYRVLAADPCEQVSRD